MARRPSTVSVASLASSRTPLESLRSPGAASVLSPPASKLLRAISQSGSLTSTQDNAVDIEPDELFAKCTIAEVKTRQAQLRYSLPTLKLVPLTKSATRAEAEAKQEDLRIMVGCVEVFGVCPVSRRYLESAGNDTVIYFKPPPQSYPLQHPRRAYKKH